MILVTGGSGVLGSALLKLLIARGDRVRAIINNKALSVKSELIEQWPCDLFDPYSVEEALIGCDRVYHCAGLVSFNPKHRGQLVRTNVEATANLVNACLAGGISKLVHVSSVAALGRMRDGETISETSAWSIETNNSVYGESKYAGELEVWRGMAEGLPAAIVNPVVILGPGDLNASSTRIFRAAYNNFPYYSEGVTGFVSADDVARAMMRLMDSDVVNERFVISSEDKTYREVFTQAATCFGSKPPQKKITPFLAALAWRGAKFMSIFTGREPLVTKETAATALAKVRFDNSKFLKFFPDFRYTPVNQAIAETCKALQQKINS